MGEIIARFADGRLLVQEDRAVETDAYTSGIGIPVRIGHVKTVEKVLSLDAYVSGYLGNLGHVVTPLKEATTSGDTIHVIMRRGDVGDEFSFLSALGISGSAALGVLSGITSGFAYLEEIASGRMLSGRMKVIANVIGF